MDDYSQLVTEAQQHENPQQRSQAFNQLIHRFQQLAYRHAFGIIRDAPLAEDAVQESFVTVFKQLDHLRDPSAFPGWLRAIVRTHALRLLRHQAQVSESLDGMTLEIPIEADLPEQWFEERELQRRLNEAINRLPEHERVVTERFYLQSQSLNEIAESLSLPVTTVKKRLQYARQHLRGLVFDFSMLILLIITTGALVVMLGQPMRVSALQPQYAPIPVLIR
ncbi:MAG: sigma-70 family RNA polymerase sigma factor [Anaerolineae bacterium]|jgi:RNA polymerase sigma-70 factor (ECF subfamily)|nr:sigma-70 family RNA polymerase sigma factor [Anaerolineae bacterium]